MRVIIMFYLGIDISKDKFDVALLDGKKGKHKVFKNNEDGFRREKNVSKQKAPQEFHLKPLNLTFYTS